MGDKPVIQWISAINDSSGYGNATRNYIYAIAKTQRVDISVGGVSFEAAKTSHILDSVVQPLIKNNLAAPIHIIHLTPENFARFYAKGKYHIGYVAWETNKLPDSWVPEINKLNEVWVPSTWNVQVFKNSGITIPVFCVPHAISVPDIDVPKPTYLNDDPSDFWFYTIGQWTNRKNLMDLLLAYYTEFYQDSNVVLAMKTYRRDASPAEINIIKNSIQRLKQDLRLPVYPRLLLFGNLLTDDEIVKLHLRGDCFVLPSRAEGFGITQADAMAVGNPTISSNYGGVVDFMNDSNSLLIRCAEKPVQGMDYMPIYNATMTWGDPDIMDMRKKMRWVFENREAAKKLGQQARQDITNNYSHTKIGNLIADRLETIWKEKGFGG